MPEIEFHPDLKQQQNESQAREDLQRLRRRGVEYGVEGARRDPTEERGSEQDADDDFADGGGLAAALGHRPADAPRQDDDGEFQEGVEEQQLRLVRTRE
jgi:hypothetical protein